MDSLFDASMLSSSAPTNNSFHVNNAHHAHLSSSVSNPSLNNKGIATKTPSVPVLPKHVDPFADDPFNSDETQKESFFNEPSTVVATSSQNWADFSSESFENRTQNANSSKNGGFTNISSDAWTDPFGAPAPAEQKKGVTTSDGQPLFDSSPFGDFDFSAK